jgi:F0F1-type ATP synthase assembly protein I
MDTVAIIAITIVYALLHNPEFIPLFVVLLVAVHLYVTRPYDDTKTGG